VRGGRLPPGVAARRGGRGRGTFGRVLAARGENGEEEEGRDQAAGVHARVIVREERTVAGVADLGARLEEIAARPPAERLARDPLGLVREAQDREGAALVAAALAFGNARAIRGSAAVALRALHEGRTRVPGFRHRWVGEEDLAALLRGLARCRRRFGSLEACFRAGDEGDLAAALDRFADELRGRGGSRVLRFLLPRPRDGSACKRMLLFLRWVARPDDGVDLGLWESVDPARLVVPLDTHVHRIAWWLGLTDRRAADWRTAVEVTESLRRYDPDDPVRFDFALAHLGILGDCPRRPLAAKCAQCPLRLWCRVWDRGAAHLQSCTRLQWAARGCKGCKGCGPVAAPVAL
jgi:uncharacterized protein (TIGR02757 family)